MAQWTAKLLERIAAAGLSYEDMQKLYSSPLGDPIVDYNLFMYQTVGVPNAYPVSPLGTSFPLGSKYADAINASAIAQINQLCCDLLDKLDEEKVSGAVVEFGVAGGSWLKMILDHMDRQSTLREVYGFDSFEGLPEPDRQNDGNAWKKGQYANPLEAVQKFLKVSDKSHLHLLKGWFLDSFKKPEAQDIRKIAFAKVDCDLYGPAVECLDFLANRLSNGAVLMFDDWPHLATLGETKAFMEWVQRVPQYRFEFIGFINWRIFFKVQLQQNAG
jgi:hypothetical protein